MFDVGQIIRLKLRQEVEKEYRNSYAVTGEVLQITPTTLCLEMLGDGASNYEIGTKVFFRWEDISEVW